MAKWKRINNDLSNEPLQTTAQKTKDRAQHEPHYGGELSCPGRVISSCSTNGTRRVALIVNLIASHEWGNLRIPLLASYCIH
jgi:hypothetical protein